VYVQSVLLLVIAALGCSEQPVRPPDVVLLVFDTVRRDHLSTYGYSRDTSPNLSGLRAQGRLYTNAYSSGSWTVPSHASIFTGFYAVRHGATQESEYLEADLETLAENLRAKGYETVGVTGNAVITRERGFSQGFDTYKESWKGVDRQDRDLVTLSWIESFLAGRDPDKPLFLFVNLIGAHTPYNSCGENCGAFGEDIEGGPVDSKWANYYRGLQKFSEADIDRLVKLYDTEILQVDAIFGRILSAIDRHLPRESTLVIVTADHGENIGDHGHMNHVFSVHESLIQVPLVIRYPERVEANSSEDSPVQLVDLFPTILHAAVPDEAPRLHHGVDLLGRLEPQRPALSEYYRPDQATRRFYEKSSPATRARFDPYRRRIRSVIDDGWKLIWGSDGRHELYDLRSDPDELRNLYDDAPEKARELETTLQAMLEQYSEGGAAPVTTDGRESLPPLDAETEAELEALGYIN